MHSIICYGIKLKIKRLNNNRKKYIKMDKTKNSFNQAKIIGGKYQIVKKLKTGGFGSVYIARGVDEDQKKYAVKILNKKNERYANIEIQMYNLFKEKKFTLGIVKNYDHGVIGDQIFLAMELIGLDLQEIMAKMKNNKFSIKTVLMIGLQLIDRIQALHSFGFVHRDIKPDNLAIGNKQKINIIYLLDFGLAIKISDRVPAQEKDKMIGTLAFMSIRTQQGKKANFFDDLQSFTYTLIYMILGTLPWIHINVKTVADYQRVKLLKQKLNKDWFKRNQIPVQIFQILTIAREGTSKDKVDYLNIKYKLLSIFHSRNEQNDFKFDWCGIPGITHDKSPGKRVQQRMKINEKNRSNQKIVQDQIYQVYKFMDHEKIQEQAKSPKKQQKKKKESPKKDKKKQHQRRQSQRKLQTAKQKEREKAKRPASTNSKQRQNMIQKGNIFNQIDKRIRAMANLNYQGPKIMINNTAQYRL